VISGTTDGAVEHDPALCEGAMGAWAEGRTLWAAARIIPVDQETGWTWRDWAAQQCRLATLYMGQQLPLRACQLDRLWSIVQTTNEPLAWAKTSRDTSGEAWGWVAGAPACRLGVACVVSKRTPAEAPWRLERVAQVTTDLSPCVSNDPRADYRTALRQVSGAGYQPPRRGPRGPHPHPRRVPPQALREAQVVKTRTRGRVVAVDPHGGCGDAQHLAARWATLPTGASIHTRVVEGAPLALRHHHRRLTRQTTACSQALPGLEKPLWWSLAYPPVMVPQARGRQALPKVEPTRERETGSPRHGQPRTLARAAGLTDQVWTTDELRSSRVPARVVEQRDQLEHLWPQLEPIDQGT
jgi:hypothetical protein